MYNFNVVVVVDVYNEHGGASSAAMRCGREYSKLFRNSYIICNSVVKGEAIPKDVFVINNEKDLFGFLIEKRIDVIHYFKAQKSLVHFSIFNRIVHYKRKYNIKVVTTVCQQPSYPSVILTPFEIRYSDHLVFIDKTAFSDSLYNFIPIENKSWMYLLPPWNANNPLNKFEKRDYSCKKKVLFGRGSTLEKCPKDVIDIYDKINITQEKEFYIVGVPDGNNWLRNKIIGRRDIHSCPIQNMEKWAEIAQTFDICIYYLPSNIYSSIDGALGTVLRNGVPTIVYGPPAPKERIIHGVNGFIANTKDEIIKYAELLARDENLRRKIGQSARKHIIDDSPKEYWVDKHARIINDLCIGNISCVKIKIPFTRSIHLTLIKAYGLVNTLCNKIYGKLIYAKL